jgi:uncharacterized protein
MKELIEYIVKELVNNPDAVIVEEEKSGTEVNLTLTVHPEDMGIIIGKSGQTIKAIRKLAAVRAMAEEVRVNLQLNETGSPQVAPAEDVEEAAEEAETETEELKEEEKSLEIEEKEDSPKK